MWICNKCQYKNNNSSETCHGKNCDGTKIKDTLIIQGVNIVKKKKEKKKVLDYCPACKKDMFFTQIKRKGKPDWWFCESHKHRPCELVGRSKPISSYLPKVNI